MSPPFGTTSQLSPAGVTVNAPRRAHDCSRMARFAAILSSCWKRGDHCHDWKGERSDTDSFVPALILPLMLVLIEHVHDMTGHHRPKGWRSFPRMARS